MKYLVPTVRPIAEDLAGTLAFYLLYLATGSALIGAVVGLSIGVAQMVRHRSRREPVPPILAVGVLLTAILGGASVVTRDPRFVLLKPSILYAAIAVPMFRRGWVLRYVPAVAHDLLPRATFDRVGRGWAMLMVGTAIANLILVAVLPPRTTALIFTIGAALAKLILFAGQYAVLRRRAGRNHANRASAE